jgi:hypothetical protein
MTEEGEEKGREGDELGKRNWSREEIKLKYERPFRGKSGKRKLEYLTFTNREAVPKCHVGEPGQKKERQELQVIFFGDSGAVIFPITGYKYSRQCLRTFQFGKGKVAPTPPSYLLLPPFPSSFFLPCIKILFICRVHCSCLPY